MQAPCPHAAASNQCTFLSQNWGLHVQTLLLINIYAISQVVLLAHQTTYKFLKHASPTGCFIGPKIHQLAVLLCSGVLVIYLSQNLMSIQNYLAITYPYPYITYPLKVNSCFNSLMLALITFELRGTSPRISSTGNKIVLKWGNFGDKTTPLPPLLKLGCLLFCTDSCSLNSSTTLHGGGRGRKALFSLF